ncbi:hypothetical protein WME89_24295 [Sorangium sp. So ce321]|uniref:hypothetical protein n=1 Tax=Sorangium sp. So ce321 TaxID=3133300 RepID=UPI003F5F484C
MLAKLAASRDLRRSSGLAGARQAIVLAGARHAGALVEAAVRAALRGRAALTPYAPSRDPVEVNGELQEG